MEQKQRLSLLFRQFAERSLQALRALAVLRQELRPRARVDESIDGAFTALIDGAVDRTPATSVLGAERVERHVPRDAENPRPHRLIGAQLVAALEHTSKGLVGAIFDIGVVSSSTQQARNQSLNGRAALGDDIHEAEGQSGGRSAERGQE